MSTEHPLHAIEHGRDVEVPARVRRPRGAHAFTTTGGLDLFAQGLYALALFLLVALLGRLRHVARCCPFRVTWWAVSFPLAACAIASLRVAAAFPSSLNDVIAGALLAAASAVIAWLAWRTLAGIARGELRQLT